MGHRALVIYDIEDTLAVSYSHWGALDLCLEEEIDADALDGDDTSGRFLAALKHAVDSTNPDLDFESSSKTDAPIEPPHEAVPKSHGIEAAIDAHGGLTMMEAVYLVDVDLTPGSGRIHNRVRSVDVTGYRVIGTPFLNVDLPDDLPQSIVYRGCEMPEDDYSRICDEAKQSVEKGWVDGEEANRRAAEGIAHAIDDDGGVIPTWSPIGSEFVHGATLEGVRGEPVTVDEAKELYVNGAISDLEFENYLDDILAREYGVELETVETDTELAVA